MNSGKTDTAVFFGSGPVAARSLELLLAHTSVEAVITKPRPPHHRGAVPVLEVAEAHNLPIFTAANKTELNELFQAHHFASTYAILIDFGIIVSQQVIDVFPLGIINSHFSLLPHLRGADPITWSIANGDEKTGISLMLVDQGLDTGKLITYRTYHLTGYETTPELTEQLINLSDDLLQEFVPQYVSGAVAPRNQPHPDRATYSRKLTKDDGVIDWNQPAKEIEQKIRAFIEWPQSHARLADLDVVITAAHVVDEQHAPGAILATKQSLIIGTSTQSLAIDRLKPAGKKEMPVQAFLAGYRTKL